MSDLPDLDRLRSEYARRARQQAGNSRYSLFSPDYLFTVQQRQRDLLRVLRKMGVYTLNDKRILEVGCGSGGVLLEFLLYGSSQENLFGVDILKGRLVEAHSKLPTAHFGNADGQALPYPAHSFDLVLQFTAFSSVLDDQIRKRMAREMLRTLAPGGMILWYDFWLNPTNRQTRGIRPNEIRALFEGCRIAFHKVTLAPPVARKVVPVSWQVGAVLESIKVFNTHYLAVIQKEN